MKFVKSFRRLWTSALASVLLVVGGPALLSQEPHGDWFELVAIGDAGYPGEILRTVASTLDRHSTVRNVHPASNDALVFLGDNFYPIGLNVDSSERRRLMREVIDPQRNTLDRYGPQNVYAVPGNHDYYCDELGPIPYGTCFGGVRREANLGIWQFAAHDPFSRRYPVRTGSSDSIELVFVNSCRFLLAQPDDWSDHLDTLRQLLESSSTDKSVAWRLLFMHHSPFSVGEHSGYLHWDENVKRVKYSDPCFRDGQNVKKYVERLAGYHEDDCAVRYEMFRDSLFYTILISGAPVHITFGGHDHSLQALHQMDAPSGLPSLFVVSGGGSKQDLVSGPRHDSAMGVTVFTHPENGTAHHGLSRYGFATLRAGHNHLDLQFIDGETGDPLEMGFGTQLLRLRKSGRLERFRELPEENGTGYSRVE